MRAWSEMAASFGIEAHCSRQRGRGAKGEVRRGDEIGVGCWH
jgi:hypothetical protein